jgi:hypothetical protein
MNTTNNMGIGSQGNKQLASKNLSILEDQLNQEALLVKKFQNYASQCQDTQLQNMCNQMASKHKNHYETLLSYLNSHQ